MGKERKPQKYSIPVIISTLSSILVVSFAFILFLLAKGYRVNLTDQTISKTGAISVKTYPTNALLYIDNKEMGRTPESRVLETGNHSIRIEKEGYHFWEKDITIPEDKTTIITPWLILEENKKFTVWNSQKEAINFWVNENEDIALILLKEPEGRYSLWKYKIERSMWEILNNPMKIWESTDPNITLLLSPDGNYALLTTLTESGKASFLVNTSTSFTPAINNKIELTGLEESSIQWASDNKHLLFDSATSLLSYNITDRLMYTIFTKENTTSNYIWTTTNDGFLYLISENSQPEDTTYNYSIETVSLDGVKGEPILKNIYMQKDEKYIEYYRTQKNLFIPFTNSPENTQTVGTINEIQVNKQAKGILLTSTVASYWYSISDSKYLAISHHPSKLLNFGGDGKRLLLKTKEDLYVFTFDKESLDHTEEIGLKLVPNIKIEDKPKWISNSKHFSFVKDGVINISESDGENSVKTLSIDNINFFTIKKSRDNILTFEKDEQGFFNINEYRL